MDLTMDTSSRFWDRMAARYAKSPILDEAAYQHKLELSRSYFHRDMEVLEFGCGTGGTAVLHAPFVSNIRAIDVSPRMIEIAKGKRLEAKADNLSFVVGSIENISIPDGSFDAILGLSILHLLNDKEGVIDKVQRLLKPGGVFISSTACLGDGLNFLKYILALGHKVGLIPVVKVFTAKQLIETLETAGFQIEHQWQPGKGKAVFIVARNGRTI